MFTVVIQYGDLSTMSYSSPLIGWDLYYVGSHRVSHHRHSTVYISVFIDRHGTLSNLQRIRESHAVILQDRVVPASQEMTAWDSFSHP